MPHHYGMTVGKSAAIAKPGSAAKKRAKKINGLLSESKSLRGKMKTAVNAEVDALKKGEAELKAVAKKTVAPKKAAAKKPAHKKAAPKKAAAKKPAHKKAAPKKAAAKKPAHKKSAPKKAAAKKPAHKKSTHKTAGVGYAHGARSAHSTQGWCDKLVAAANTSAPASALQGLTTVLRAASAEHDRGSMSATEIQKLRDCTKFLHLFATHNATAAHAPSLVKSSHNWAALSKRHHN